MPKCRDCPAPAAPGRAKCRPCLDRAAAWKRGRAAAGLCPCGEPVKAGRKKCPGCLAADAARRKADYEARKAAGRCGMSGCRREPRPGRVYCGPHLRAITAQTTAIRARDGRR
jgi:hypothetical protein